MLTIRLTRVGKKKQPTYRFVISEKTKDPWGNHLEILGHMNPRTNPATIVLKEDRVKYWLEKGAQTSNTVRNLLIDKKMIQGEKVRIVKMSRKKQAAIIDAKAKQVEAAAKADEKANEAAAKAKEEEEKKEAPEAKTAESAPEVEAPVVEAVADAPAETPTEAPAPEENPADTPTEPKPEPKA